MRTFAFLGWTVGEKSRKVERLQGFSQKFVDFSKMVIIILSCMDMRKSSFTAGNNGLTALTQGRVVVGAKQLRKALNAQTVQRAFLARNADPALTEPIEVLCRQNDIAYTWVASMKELGDACGIEVGAASAAVLR